MTIFLKRISSADGQTRAEVLLEYAHGSVRLELPELEPLFVQEPIDQIVQRRLGQILSALSEAEQSPEGLSVLPLG
jgi:hypothetical protein